MHEIVVQCFFSFFRSIFQYSLLNKHIEIVVVTKCKVVFITVAEEAVVIVIVLVVHVVLVHAL